MANGLHETDTGGPAFPHDKYTKHGDQWSTYAHGGMSLRDYFAAAALTGLVARDNNCSLKDRVELAFGYADAMIAARGAK